MPMSTDCLAANGRKQFTVVEALALHANERRGLICLECRRRVIPHSLSSDGTQAAHFEHFRRNPKCSLSDKRFR
jgi:hypothetical protein